MAEFPRNFFSSGDSPKKLLNHKFLNWLVERCSRDIVVEPGLTLASNSYFTSIGLAERIIALRPVELVEVLEANSYAESHSIRIVDNFSVIVDETLPLTVIDIFGTRSIIGTRGIALQVEFSTDGLWIFIPITTNVLVSSSSSSSSSTSGDDISECNIPPPRPSDINGRIRGTIQLLGVDADGCWRLYEIGQGCSSSGA